MVWLPGGSFQLIGTPEMFFLEQERTGQFDIQVQNQLPRYLHLGRYTIQGVIYVYMR